MHDHETTVTPRTQHHRNLRSALGAGVVLCAVLAGSASGSPRGERERERALRPRIAGVHCVDAGRAELSVGDGGGFDAIRVVVDQTVPGAATDVTVLVGLRDRTLRTLGGGEWGLALDEPLRARRVQVAIEPVLDAPAGACIDRVELLRDGAVVATARIR